MDELEQLLQTFMEMPRDTKIALGRDALADIDKGLVEGGVDDVAARFAFIMRLIGVAVSSDRVASMEEYALFCSIFGEDVPFDEFYELTNNGSDPEVIEAVDSIVDQLPHEAKCGCLNIAMLFMSVDGKITKNELGIFLKLLAEADDE